MYTPPYRPGLKTELLLDEKLVLVSTDPDVGGVDAPDFVAVDWGPDFAREFGSSFPSASEPGLSVNLGPLAVDYVLANGGSAFCRMRAIEHHLASGRLHLVPGPSFSYPIYAVSSSDAEESLLGPALAGLREVMSPASERSLARN